MSFELQQAFTDNLNFQELLANPAAFQNEVAKASRFKANQSPMLNSIKAGEGYKTIDINLTNELKNFEIDHQEQKDENELVELFNKAKEMVVQCQFRTKINQTAVEQGQLRLEHLRNLLLESRAKESMTYDKSGRTRGGSSGGGISA